MKPEKRLELQSMPPEIMQLALEQFGTHFIQFEIWVGRVIDKAYAMGKADERKASRKRARST